MNPLGRQRCKSVKKVRGNLASLPLSLFVLAAAFVVCSLIPSIVGEALADRQRALFRFDRWPGVEYGDWIYDDVLFLFVKSDFKEPQALADSACKELIRDGIASEVTLYVVNSKIRAESRKEPSMPYTELAHAFCNTEIPK